MRQFARTAALTGYADLCRSLGLDPAQLMASVGLDIADLEVPDRWVPAVPMARLLELSAREAGCDDFAVRMSERRGLGSLGPLSVVLREEADLRGVLEVLVRFEHAYTGVLDLRLTEEAGRATVDIRLEFGEAVPTRQVQDLVLANLAGMIRILIRPTWLPTGTHFAHETPAQLAAAAGRRIPDLIAPGLRVLFVGINPGLWSGAVGHHFARPGNRFWPVLHRAGFTPRVLSPFEERALLDLAGLVHVDADGQTLGARGNHQINELILKEIARITKRHILRNGGMQGNAPGPVRANLLHANSLVHLHRQHPLPGKIG